MRTRPNRKKKSISFVCLLPNNLPLQRTNDRKTYFSLCHVKERKKKNLAYIDSRTQTHPKHYLGSRNAMHFYCYAHFLVYIYWLLDEKSYIFIIWETICIRKWMDDFYYYIQHFFLSFLIKWEKSYNCSGFQIKLWFYCLGSPCELCIQDIASIAIPFADNASMWHQFIQFQECGTAFSSCETLN